MTQQPIPNGDRPAFPTDRIADEACHANGLTKREWLAGLAMQAMVPDLLQIGMHATIDRADAAKIPQAVAEGAVTFADALLMELERRENERAQARQEGRLE